MERKRRRGGYFLLFVTITLCLIIVGIVYMYIPKNSAEAVSSGVQTTDIGNILLDNYENTNKKFDSKKLDKLYAQITGKENAMYSDVVAAAKQKKTSADFRSKDNEQTQGSLITFIFGEYEWNAVYLSTNRDGDPILTVWLANSNEMSQWNKYSVNSNGDYPSSMYSTSFIRTEILNNTGFYYTDINGGGETFYTQSSTHKYAKFTSTIVNGSLTEFIDEPAKVEWQEKQISHLVNEHIYDFNNDAYGDVGSGGGSNANWASNMVNYYNKPSEDNNMYDDWKDDKLWLPSMTEAGWHQYRHLSIGIWKTDLDERGNANGIDTWLRSSFDNDHYRICTLLADGSDGADHTIIDTSVAVRPAFHLNLKKVEEYTARAVTNPIDVCATYTGQLLTLSNVPEDQKIWYNAAKMEITYLDENDNPVEGLLNAAVHKVKVSLKQVLVDEGVKFDGIPDTSIGEDEYTRYFSFTINKKKIGVDITKSDSGGYTATAKSGEIFSGDTGDRAPAFGFHYESTDGKGYNSDVYPTNIGQYRATVKMTNECNYELDTANISYSGGSYPIAFTIDKREIDKPTISIKTLPYNGREQTFEISGFSADVRITTNNGMTYDPATGKLTAKNVKEYTVTIALADNGAETQWKGGGTTQEDIKVSITAVTLGVTFASEGGWTWNSNTEKEISITDDRLNADDKLTFSFSYDGAAIDSGRVTYDGNNTKVKIPPLPEKSGAYVLRVTLEKSGEGGNYILTTNNTQEFRVSEREIEVNKNNISWQYANFNISGGALQDVDNWDSVLAVMYNGGEYTFSAVLDDYLKDNGVTVSGYVNQKGTAVNSYSTTVNLTSSQGKLTQSSFTIQWRIDKGKYDLSKLEWDYTDGQFVYDKTSHEIVLKNLPATLEAEYEYDGVDSTRKDAGEYTAVVIEFINSDSNYIDPIIGDPNTYTGTFDSEKVWSIKKAQLSLAWEDQTVSGAIFKIPQVTDSDKINGYKYYIYQSGAEGNKGDEVQVSEMVENQRYIVEVILKESIAKNYDASPMTKTFKSGGASGTEVTVELTSGGKYTYDGLPKGTDLRVSNDVDFAIGDITATYYSESVSEDTKLEGAPTDVGAYIVVLEIKAEYAGSYYLTQSQISFEIKAKQIIAEWDTSGQIPVIKGLDGNLTEVVGYIYYDENGDRLPDGATLEVGKSYKVQAIIKSGYENNYEFIGLDGVVLPEVTVTEEKDFTVDNKPGGNGDGSGIGGIGSGDDQDGDKESDPSFDKALDIIKDWWQVAASGISIILIIIFLSKTAGYESRRKDAKKTVENKYRNYYVAGLFGLSMTKWTVIACVMMGCAIVSFAIMTVAKKRCRKAERELADSKDEYDRMMFMRMMGGGNMNNGAGGQAQGGFAYAQPSLGADEIRGIVSETMSAMLPNMQQYLPQQASSNDELVQRLIEQNEQLMEQNNHNEERMRQFNEQNEERIERLMEKVSAQNADRDNSSNEFVQKLIEQNEKLMKKLSEQPAEKVIEREVADTTDDETIRRLAAGQELLLKKLSEQQTVQTVGTVSDNSRIERLLEKLIELSENNKSQPQVIEKIVEKPVEKIVEVPIEVEKVVEKIVEKEVKVEVPVENVVAVPAAKPTAPKKAVAPRLTLDEAYAKLSKEQKKFFDTLKAYAKSKDKCKEKKSTYFILLGQSSVNPLVKLMVKKDTTVALFKMEDEYFKDIRRNAGSDGTKIKVKETELIVGDAQALDAAKEMIDLREDQIERYQDYIKEQRSLSKK